jgi:hypothetical protein
MVLGDKGNVHACRKVVVVYVSDDDVMVEEEKPPTKTTTAAAAAATTTMMMTNEQFHKLIGMRARYAAVCFKDTALPGTDQPWR